MPKDGCPVPLGPCPECEEIVYVTDERMASCHSCLFECPINQYETLIELLKLPEVQALRGHSVNADGFCNLGCC